MRNANTYNGWSNYETWCVNLWLSNDEGIYNTVNGMAQGARETFDPDAEAGSPYGREPSLVLADALKDFVEDLPEYASAREHASFASDLLGAALSRVDWFEIALTWLENS